MRNLERFGKIEEVKTVKTHYYDAGKGDPLVLIHGAGSAASTIWTYNINELANEFRVIALDQLGFGHTEISSEPDYSLAARAEHTIDVLDYVGIKSAFICGQSQGGWIASYIALNRPEIVKKLILVNSGSISMTTRNLGEESASAFAVRGLPARKGVEESLKRLVHRTDLITDEMIDTALEYAKKNHDISLARALATGSPENRKKNTSLHGKHISELIHQIKAPTLIVWGKLDAVPFERGLWIQDAIKSSQMHIFGDSKHMPFVDHYKEFNAIVTTFCKA